MSESEQPDESLPAEFQISSLEANYWWRKTNPLGAFMNNLMFVFIVAPVALVLKGYYGPSFFIFALMVPYGLLLRRMAVSAVRGYLANHPESVLEFREAGIIL